MGKAPLTGGGRAARAAGLTALAVSILILGCASSRKHPAGSEAPPAAAAAAGVQETVAVNPCAVAKAADTVLVDETRRRLYETLCSASLWFDGLFGDHRHPEAAQHASGRAELAVVESQYEGTDLGGRMNVRVDLPNLEERMDAFLGREDERDFVEDRNEGLALRSQFLRIDTDERWIAGLGYALPGSPGERTDFRVGSRVSTSPEVFVQARHRRDLALSSSSLLHLRETVFWTNRDGFGSTTGIDYDLVLGSRLLLRWGTIGTVSEATHGLDWRSAVVLFRHLRAHHAVAGQLFVRGSTDADVPLREYGVRAIYRRSLAGRPWLFGEGIVGYSWPRERQDEARDGSFLAGIGIELLFGRDF